MGHTAPTQTNNPGHAGLRKRLQSIEKRLLDWLILRLAARRQRLTDKPVLVVVSRHRRGTRRRYSRRPRH